MKQPKGYKPRASPARIQEWVNEQVAKAREQGLVHGLGVDKAETIASLVIENNRARALLELAQKALAETDDGKRMSVAVEVAVFLSLPPAQLVLRPAVAADAQPSGPDAGVPFVGSAPEVTDSGA